VVDHLDLACCRLRKINNPTPNKGATIVHAHNHPLTSVFANNPNHRPKRQRAMCCREVARIEDLAACRASSRKPWAVPARVTPQLRGRNLRRVVLIQRTTGATGRQNQRPEKQHQTDQRPVSTIASGYIFRFCVCTSHRPRVPSRRGSANHTRRDAIMSLAPLIVERAHELGFSAVGFVAVGEVSHREHLRQWLNDGMHGEMRWMENHSSLREDTRLLEPGMRTVIALAAPYFSGPPGEDPLVARYAQGDDYHDVLRRQMRQLGAFVEAESGATVATRPAVDSAPVLERNIAVDAGIGWLGKSAMVLRQGHGSFFFLAELFVDLEIDPTDKQHPDRCGRCTRCIDLCPTGAIVAPFRVDARRCISYLTIELRGAIPRALRRPIGARLFGCDVCQSVCPWNHNPAAEVLREFSPRPEVATIDARRILAMSQAEFSAVFAGSALKRTRREGLARNASVVLGNSRDTEHVDVLAAAMASDPSPLVRGHAAWALGEIAGRTARVALERGCASEHDDYVLEEMRFALQTIASS
jgi:epoxyqueuosine reductase